MIETNSIADTDINGLVRTYIESGAFRIGNSNTISISGMMKALQIYPVSDDEKLKIIDEESNKAYHLK